jgi:hypothetical protein
MTGKWRKLDTSLVLHVFGDDNVSVVKNVVSHMVQSVSTGLQRLG